MALLDLSLVTTTLLRLLRARVDPLWATFFPPVPPPPVINYTGVLERRHHRRSGDRDVSLLRQRRSSGPKSAACISRPSAGPVHANGRCAAVSTGGPRRRPWRSGRRRSSRPKAFGLALKTLHDFPSIDRNTDFGGPIFPVELQGTENVIRISKRNIPPLSVPNFFQREVDPSRRLLRSQRHANRADRGWLCSASRPSLRHSDLCSWCAATGYKPGDRQISSSRRDSGLHRRRQAR